MINLEEKKVQDNLQPEAYIKATLGSKIEHV